MKVPCHAHSEHGELVASHSHKRKLSRGTGGVQEKHLTNERIRDEQPEV